LGIWGGIGEPPQIPKKKIIWGPPRDGNETVLGQVKKQNENQKKKKVAGSGEP